MLVDPLIRFNWIFYAIFRNELQHSAILSFLVALTEICRRAMWALFRVENEHCTNVGKYRASRDVPLPYEFVSQENLNPVTEHGLQVGTTPAREDLPVLQPHPEDFDVEQAQTSSSSIHRPSTIRRRFTEAALGDSPIARSINRVGTLITEAHAHDFERKKRPGQTCNSPEREELERQGSNDLSSDESEGEAGQADLDNEAEVLHAQSILERHKSATEN
jgi:hypothetical protein